MQRPAAGALLAVALPALPCGVSARAADPAAVVERDQAAARAKEAEARLLEMIQQLHQLMDEEARAQEPGDLERRRQELSAVFDEGRVALDRRRDALRSAGYSICLAQGARYVSRVTAADPAAVKAFGRHDSLPRRAAEDHPELDSCVQHYAIERSFAETATQAIRAQQEELVAYKAARARWDEREQVRRYARRIVVIAAAAGVAALTLLLLLRRRGRAPEAALLQQAPLPSPDAAPASQPEPAPAAVAAGYSLLKDAGSTPLGDIFQARGRGGPALLLRLDGLPEQDPGRARCVQAVSRALSLKHPNLAVQRLVFDGGIAYLAADGAHTTLRGLLDAGRPEPAWALAALAHVAAGLDFAHSRGVVHGGLMPETVLVGADRVARLMALGAGAALRAAAKESGWRPRLGSPAYTAPEEELGSDRPESDVFSLGVVLYELAAGTLPFVGPNFPAQKRERAYVPAGRQAQGWPRSLDAAVARALDPDPARRWRSGAELVAALRAP